MVYVVGVHRHEASFDNYMLLRNETAVRYEVLYIRYTALISFRLLEMNGAVALISLSSDISPSSACRLGVSDTRSPLTCPWPHPISDTHFLLAALTDAVIGRCIPQLVCAVHKLHLRPFCSARRTFPGPFPLPLCRPLDPWMVSCLLSRVVLTTPPSHSLTFTFFTCVV